MDLKTWQIIKDPIMTEKTHKLSLRKVYVFSTDYHANKIAIKNAFEFLFSVKVKSVHTRISHPKARRVGKFAGFKKRQKIAYFQLAEGQKMDIFKASHSIQKQADKKKVTKIDKLKDVLFNVSKKSLGGADDEKAGTKQAFLQKAFELLKNKKKIELSKSAQRGVKIRQKQEAKEGPRKARGDKK